jgi:hypothetical protein
MVLFGFTKQASDNHDLIIGDKEFAFEISENYWFSSKDVATVFADDREILEWKPVNEGQKESTVSPSVDSVGL